MAIEESVSVKPISVRRLAKWREDNRRESNGDQVRRLASLALAHKPSVDFTGYWQRHKAA